MNFIYTINPDADEPEMVIDSHIGPDEVLESGEIIKGVNGSQWARELLALDATGKRRVKVYINSPGGSVSDGYSICSAMLHTKCKVDTYCRGLAASMAAVAFMCGRNRCMADFGILMFHNPFGGDNNELLEKMKNSLVTLISARCGLATETVSGIMERTTWLDPSDALEIPGLITSVEPSTENNVGRLAPVKNDAKMYWREAQQIFNSALKIEVKNNYKNDNDTNMSTEIRKINARLGLMEEASVDSTNKAIEAIVNKAEASDKKAKDAEAAFEKKEAEMKKMKADMEDEAKKQKEAYDKIEAEYKSMKDEKAAFEKKTKEEGEAKAKAEAKDLITNAVKVGKIKNEADIIAKWTAKAEANPIEVKEILDMMGVNATAPVITAGAGEGKVNNKPFASDKEAVEVSNKLISSHMDKVKANLGLKK
jgi:ATP-dependent Clp protease, protease subunit